MRQTISIPSTRVVVLLVCGAHMRNPFCLRYLQATYSTPKTSILADMLEPNVCRSFPFIIIMEWQQRTTSCPSRE